MAETPPETDRKSTQTRQKPTRRAENRPRIDAILRGIASGRYDEELKQLSEAITERQKARQQHVMELVEEVYGPDYTVQVARKGLMQRSEPEVPVVSADRGLGDPIPEAEIATDDDLGPDHESRSPIIG